MLFSRKIKVLRGKHFTKVSGLFVRNNKIMVNSTWLELTSDWIILFIITDSPLHILRSKVT